MNRRPESYPTFQEKPTTCETHSTPVAKLSLGDSYRVPLIFTPEGSMMELELIWRAGSSDVSGL